MAYIAKPRCTWLALFVLCGALGGCSRSATDGVAPLPPVASSPAPAPAAPGRGVELPRFVEQVREQGGAVVNISATRAGAVGGVPPGHPLYDFFRRFGGVPDPGEEAGTSVGSGFIISDDGYILTNAHVIDATSAIRVKLTSKREYSAKVIGADPYTDVALLKIDARNLRPVRTGNPGAQPQQVANLRQQHRYHLSQPGWPGRHGLEHVRRQPGPGYRRNDLDQP